jgi:drug/metabolite transporter (DMT)-like permease
MQGKTRGTLLGFVAIVLWSTTVPAARGLLEKLGPLPGSSLSFLLAGVTLVSLASVQARGFEWVRRLSRRHLAVCGPLVVGYLVLLYLALGMARTRSEAVVAGLVNYLWPTMILLFSVPILRGRPRPIPFVVGIGMSLGGVLLATSGETGGLGAVFGRLATGSLPLLLAFAASVLWGLYSNLAKRFPQAVPTGAVGVYLLAGGGILLLASLGQWPRIVWTLRTGIELGYLVLFPMAVAYSLWDVAMRDGEIALVGSASNLIPVVSTAIAGAYLGVSLRGELLGGAALVVVGALLSRAAFARLRR